jgi:hypothetical protein
MEQQQQQQQQQQQHQRGGFRYWDNQALVYNTTHTTAPEEALDWKQLFQRHQRVQLYTHDETAAAVVAEKKLAQRETAQSLKHNVDLTLRALVKDKIAAIRGLNLPKAAQKSAIASVVQARREALACATSVQHATTVFATSLG